MPHNKKKRSSGASKPRKSRMVDLLESLDKVISTKKTTSAKKVQKQSK